MGGLSVAPAPAHALPPAPLSLSLESGASCVCGRTAVASCALPAPLAALAEVAASVPFAPPLLTATLERDDAPGKGRVQVRRVPLAPAAGAGTAASASAAAELTRRRWRALLPSTPLDAPGAYVVVLRLAGVALGPPVPLALLAHAYGQERINLPADKGHLARRARGEGAPDRGASGAQAIEALVRRCSWRAGGALGCRPEPTPVGALRALVHPCVALISSRYGLQRFYDGVFAEGYFHRGLDYAAAKGAPVVAPAEGVVRLVGREEAGFAVHGNCIGVDHGAGVVTLFLHLDSADVRPGQRVMRGQKIGEVGDTGVATGPHLHFGLYVHGHNVDPEQWLH